MTEELRALPRVDRVLAHATLAAVCQRLGRDATRVIVRAVIAEARDEVRSGAVAIDEAEAARRAVARAEAAALRPLPAVVNATGVLLHTNLGRAPLSTRAAEAVAASARRYAALELELASGRRGGRAAWAEAGLAGLAGAEAALVVNNNAAAVLLALAAVALGRAVLVSRGELVEIGGGFRIPEVLARSGARLVEVGTTNRTKLSDYARALDEENDVAAILRVHRGNFRQTGFVEEPELRDLVRLAGERGVRVVLDLGGGALVDLRGAGLAHDPLVREGVLAGCDLVTFSTDKALGGPQGGVLVGKREAVERARRDPLARALRLGRLPLVALEATLASYVEGRAEDVPFVAMARAPVASLDARAASWRDRLRDRGVRVELEVVASEAVAGGGTYAGDVMPSRALAVRVADPDALVARLRTGAAPVLARIDGGVVLVDARTVLPGEDDALVDALASALLS